MNRRRSETTSKGNALIFDIQRFSLHDGPGIRTTVFFKGCSLRCAWCQNPESISGKAQIAFYAERCRRCFSCREVCPRDAILDGDRRINDQACDSCGVCAAACPFDALRLVGRTWSDVELAAEILMDRDFFADSGGGVTLSGGEPMLQFPFLELLLPRLREEGIPIALETSGCCRRDWLEKVVPYLDLMYFDLKHMDSASHREYTGRDNGLILDNFSRLAGLCDNLQARMPVIPGINDGRENISATAGFLRKNRLKKIRCLPYHSMGEAKLSRMETGQGPLNRESATSEDMKRIKKAFRKEGIDAVVSD